MITCTVSAMSSIHWTFSEWFAAATWDHHYIITIISSSSSSKLIKNYDHIWSWSVHMMNEGIWSNCLERKVADVDDNDFHDDIWWWYMIKYDDMWWWICWQWWWWSPWGHACRRRCWSRSRRPCVVQSRPPAKWSELSLSSAISSSLTIMLLSSYAA